MIFPPMDCETHRSQLACQKEDPEMSCAGSETMCREGGIRPLTWTARLDFGWTARALYPKFIVGEFVSSMPSDTAGVRESLR